MNLLQRSCHIKAIVAFLVALGNDKTVQPLQLLVDLSEVGHRVPDPRNHADHIATGLRSGVIEGRNAFEAFKSICPPDVLVHLDPRVSGTRASGSAANTADRSVLSKWSTVDHASQSGTNLASHLRDLQMVLIAEDRPGTASIVGTVIPIAEALSTASRSSEHATLFRKTVTPSIITAYNVLGMAPPESYRTASLPRSVKAEDVKTEGSGA